jgi:hypothetical protein
MDDMTLFGKVFEFDIYQEFLQMRQTTHRQMFSLSF